MAALPLHCIDTLPTCLFMVPPRAWRYRRYYLPTILALGGVQKQAALLLSLLPAATNALGTLVGMRYIDRCGRRRLLLTSIAAVVLALAALGSAFLAAERHSPPVAPGGTCPAGAGGAAPADCTACLRLGCGFCGGGRDPMAPGSCMALGRLHQQGQQQQPQLPPPPPPPIGCATQLFLHGCPSRYTWLILACLVAYLAAFSPGLGPVPWAVNAEIYPLAVRGTATGDNRCRQHCQYWNACRLPFPALPYLLPSCCFPVTACCF
jgi:SP family myo-inositol transporter-like MFS transporter 13